MTPETALLAVGGLHLGFQAVVAVVVYPALVSTRTEDWDAVHADHSRRISYLVVPLYATVAGVCLWALLAGPITTWVVLAVAGHVVAAGVTAVSAAPTHGRLGRDGPSPRELRRLVVADRVRLAGAVLAFAAALAL